MKKSERPLTKINLCTVSYNTKDLITRQIRYLEKEYADEHKELFDLTIYDNCSGDGTQGALLDWENPPDWATTIFGEENRGYSYACNYLGSKGDAEIIGLLNADVWLTANDAKKIAESFDKHPEMDIMGPKQRDENGYIRHAGIEGTNTAPKHRGWAVHDPDDTLFRDYKEMVTVSGSAYFIRRSVWDALTNDEEYQALVPGAQGPFLPTPHYYEETWVSYFARHRGYRVFYDGSISIGHTWHASHKVGSEHDKKFSISQRIFRDACDIMGIERD